jgi:hypothetical protein
VVVAAMENRIAFPLPLRKLTQRVTDLRKPQKTPLQIEVAVMAEAEEDFSSLPLPDRFQHKVNTFLPRTPPKLTRFYRYGKYERQHTKTLPNNSKSHPMNTILPFDPSCKTLGCGRERSQIQMWRHNRRVSQHCVRSSSLADEMAAQGVYSKEIRKYQY